MTKISNRYNYKHLRKELRTNMTKSERILWYQINRDQILGLRFRRQFGVGSYIVDFYCPEIKLVIEVDGFTHYNENVFDNDQIRQKFLENLGLIVKRYNSEQIFNDLENVTNDIYHTCEELKTVLCP